jgi:hypothetical protein
MNPAVENYVVLRTKYGFILKSGIKQFKEIKQIKDKNYQHNFSLTG